MKAEEGVFENKSHVGLLFVKKPTVFYWKKIFKKIPSWEICYEIFKFFELKQDVFYAVRMVDYDEDRASVCYVKIFIVGSFHFIISHTSIHEKVFFKERNKNTK